MTDEQLIELLDLICARGKFSALNFGLRLSGPYFHTYPNHNPDLHAAVLELEDRGFMRRLKVEDDHFAWEPTEQAMSLD